MIIGARRFDKDTFPLPGSTPVVSLPNDATDPIDHCDDESMPDLLPPSESSESISDSDYIPADFDLKYALLDERYWSRLPDMDQHPTRTLKMEHELSDVAVNALVRGAPYPEDPKK